MSIIAGLTALLGTIVKANADAAAKSAEVDVAHDQLDFQREQADRQEQLLTATQRDAFGNKQSYDPLLGFSIELAPMVQAIVDAQTEERYKSTRLDAETNRNARTRQDNRSKMADSAWQDAFTSYVNGPKPDEGRAQADAMEQAIRMFQAPEPAVNGAVTQAIRMGNPNAVAALVGKDRQPPQGMPDLVSAVMAAKQQGTNQYLAEKQARDSTAQNELSYLGSIADAAPQASLAFGNDAETQSARAASAVQALSDVIFRNMQAQQSGYSALGNAVGKSVDYSQIFSALGSVLGDINMAPEEQAKLQNGGLTEIGTMKDRLFI